jgi:hypothetical protein
MAGVEGEYWLKRQVGVGHLARVWVDVEPHGCRRVQIAPDACAWLTGIHGSDAVTAVPPDLKAAADSGAGYALATARASGTVTVARICSLKPIPQPMMYGFAAVWAVWQAIGHQPASLPWIDRVGVHFPPPAS